MLFFSELGPKKIAVEKMIIHLVPKRNSSLNDIISIVDLLVLVQRLKSRTILTTGCH